jgi:hypothetical protein
VQTAIAPSADPYFNGLTAEDVIVAMYDEDISYGVCVPSIVNQWPLTPEISTLSPADNGEGDGTYSIDRSATGHAETYVLEEATDSGCSRASVIYSGPGTG